MVDDIYGTATSPQPDDKQQNMEYPGNWFIHTMNCSRELEYLFYFGKLL